MATSTSNSTTRSQNGSNSGRANDRGPRSPGGAAGRISTARAPRSTHHSSSSMALSTMGRVTMGTGKMRPS